MPSSWLARRDMRQHRAVQASRPQPGQVGDRRAGARQHDQVGVAQRAGIGGEHDIQVGFQTQRVDIGEVADPWQSQDDHPAGTGIRRAPARQVKGVL